MSDKKTTMHVCVGVGKDFKCRFDGACYGEICISPKWCSKQSLTDDERLELNKIRAELGMSPYPKDQR